MTGNVILLAAVLALPSQGSPALVGNWRGHWHQAGDSMAVDLAIHQDSTGRYVATFGADRLRASGIPFAALEVIGCCDVTMTLRGDRSTTIFTGRLAGDSLTGSFRDGTAEGQFRYGRVTAAGMEVEERVVTFGDGSVTLAGTLLLPRSSKPAAAVVFLHGSGAEGRWASRYLAAELARNGIAALIYDKRGVGQSTGDWRTATLEDLAADGAAAVEHLQHEPRIDPRRIGLHGHSQGGMLVPMVAATSQRVAFVVGSAATGLPTDSTEILSVLNSVYPAARTATDSADARTYVGAVVNVAFRGAPRKALDSLASAFTGRPWFFASPPPDNAYWAFSATVGRFRPLDWWARVRAPVLLVYGADDQRVPARESSQRITATLRSAGNRDVTVRIYPRADHTFRLPPGASGWPVTAPGYLADLVAWLKKHTDAD